MVIRLYPDPILRKNAEKVTSYGGRTQRLIDRMQKTIHKTKALGLAAPQVGISQQVIIVEGQVMINPKTIELGEYSGDVEHCLSLPGVAAEINRPMEVKGLYQNRHGQTRAFAFAGNKARCFFHELDHLHGILITDFRGKDNG